MREDRGGKAENLRNSDPLDLPCAARALIVPTIASNSAATCWRTTAAAALIKSMQTGLRLCAWCSRPRPGAGGSAASSTSVSARSFTSSASWRRSHQQAEECTDSAMRSRACARTSRLFQPEFPHQGGLRIEPESAERGERANGAAELADQKPQLDLLEPLTWRRRRQQPSDLMAEGRGNRLLQIATTPMTVSRSARRARPAPP